MIFKNGRIGYLDHCFISIDKNQLRALLLARLAAFGIDLGATAVIADPTLPGSTGGYRRCG
jgi:hypothetical protein